MVKIKQEFMACVTFVFFVINRLKKISFTSVQSD